MIRGRLFVAAVILAGVVAVGVAAAAVAPAMRSQAMYGTVSTEGTPPLIRYCGRTYLPAPAAKSGRPMEMLNSAERIGTTPSGMPVINHHPVARVARIVPHGSLRHGGLGRDGPG